jgi:xylan 1,4-beta-xylosidase
MTQIKRITKDKKFINKKRYLKIEAREALYDFYYATNPGEWLPVMKNVDGTYLCARVPQDFVGVVIGMYASSQGRKSTNYADFDWFEYSGKDTTLQYK